MSYLLSKSSPAFLKSHPIQKNRQFVLLALFASCTLRPLIRQSRIMLSDPSNSGSSPAPREIKDFIFPSILRLPRRRIVDACKQSAIVKFCQHRCGRTVQFYLNLRAVNVISFKSYRCPLIFVKFPLTTKQTCQKSSSDVFSFASKTGTSTLALLSSINAILDPINNLFMFEFN